MVDGDKKHMSLDSLFAVHDHDETYTNNTNFPSESDSGIFTVFQFSFFIGQLKNFEEVALLAFDHFHHGQFTGYIFDLGT